MTAAGGAGRPAGVGHRRPWVRIGAAAVRADELIEAGARALYGPDETGDSLNARQMREGCRTIAEDVLEAVLPLVTAAIAKDIEARVMPHSVIVAYAAEIAREWAPS